MEWSGVGVVGEGVMVLVGPQMLPETDIKIICSDERPVEFYPLPSLPRTPQVVAVVVRC